ncbi:MAG: M48 family metallopeptidase [Synechococcales cyanobacterium K44_A2020_017]|nr:M48 family metallopeptidase [Synechococcales cyanobacterium K32_A2020_035]MBF2095975.1 M48 family metallopeptidase [Synechococcales cyanobacterium K44_A2020_017]
MTLTSYQIRESRRAKYVNIKVSPHGSVEVVVPPNFDRHHLSEILAKRQGWITKTLNRLQAERLALSLESDDPCPTEIHFRSVDHHWSVQYCHQASHAITLAMTGDRALTLTGPIDDIALCQQALRAWLRQQAKAILIPWLLRISQEQNLPIQTISVRRQKTRWGSCSSQRNISLNDKLLFLPPQLVGSVLIHELCHTLEMNHSAAFWALVAERDPHYAESDRLLDTAWRYIPNWVEPH